VYRKDLWTFRAAFPFDGGTFRQNMVIWCG
jgi:hypothetical protein